MPSKDGIIININKYHYKYPIGTDKTVVQELFYCSMKAPIGGVIAETCIAR
jgi:hypothetical protein